MQLPTFLTFLLFCLVPFCECHTAGTEFLGLPRLNKSAQQNALKFDFPALTPRAVISQTVLPVVPSVCAAYTGVGKECNTRMSATNVTFTDCGDPFTICHCDSTNAVSLQQAVSNLARVPLGLRRYIGTLMIMPAGDDGAHAYTYPSSGEMHIFGNCSFRTWLHESFHAADGSLDISLSNTKAWANAVGADSCVPDTYALSNVQEDFAQVGVVKVYMMLNQGNLPAGFEAACMQNQLNFVNNLPLFNPTTFFADNCSFNPPARHDLAPFSTQSHSIATPPATLSSTAAEQSSAAPTSTSTAWQVCPPVVPILLLEAVLSLLMS